MIHFHHLVLFHHNFHSIAQYLDMYGYYFVFAGTVFEGELIMLVAGFLASLGVMNVWLVLLVGFIGATLGDNIWYWVGKRAGPGAIARYGKYIFLGPKRIERAQRYFAAHGSKTIFVSRFVFGTRISTALLAGALGMPGKKFFRANVLGAFVWASVTVVLGYIFGHSFGLLHQYFWRTQTVLLILAIFVIIILLLRLILEER